MKRVPLKRGSGLSRGSVLKRTLLKPVSDKRRATAPDPVVEAARRAWHLATLADRVCACGCGREGMVEGHHVVYRQQVRKYGGDEWDLRNRLSIAPRCHARHHMGAKKIPLSALRKANVEFARDLLAERADEYLARHYRSS